MPLHSWLMVAGSAEADLASAVLCGADAVVVDLGDTVPLRNKAAARDNAAQWLRVHAEHVTENKPMQRWVRINAIESRIWRDDLLAVMPCAPDGVVLSQASGPDAVRQLGAELYELEQRFQIALGQTAILPVVSATPRAALSIHAFLDSPHVRLAGLAWSAPDLARAVGATRTRVGRAGRWSDAFGYVRAQVLLTAHALGIMAVDTMPPGGDDATALGSAATAASADGFSGMFATGAAQVRAVNDAFAVSGAALEQARRIVEAFADNPDAGVLEVDSRLVETPDLTNARRTLGISEGGDSGDARAATLRPA